MGRKRVFEREARADKERLRQLRLREWSTVSALLQYEQDKLSGRNLATEIDVGRVSFFCVTLFVGIRDAGACGLNVQQPHGRVSKAAGRREVLILLNVFHELMCVCVRVRVCVCVWGNSGRDNYYD